MKRLVLSMVIVFVMNNAIAQIQTWKPLVAGIARGSYQATRNIQQKEHLRQYYHEQNISSIVAQSYKDSKRDSLLSLQRFVHEDFHPLINQKEMQSLRIVVVEEEKYRLPFPMNTTLSWPKDGLPMIRKEKDGY